MPGLLDFIGGLSRGAIAGNFGAPVDMATLALNSIIAGGGYAGHKLGLLETPPALIEKPFLGSESIAQGMRNLGLLNDNPGSTGDRWGDVAGNLLPILASAKAPQIAGGLLRMSENAMVPRTMNPQAGKAFVYPQDKALATAQANAALPVERGGLGLLEGNTPMERARAMGFDTDAWHGTNKTNIKSLNRSETGAQGPGVYLGDHPTVGNDYAGEGKGANVIPALLSGKYAGNMEFSKEVGTHGWKGAEDALKASGHSGIHDTMFESAYNVFAPSNIRSRFAAFDPARRNEADLLGQADPALLALIAAGGYGGYNAMKD